MVTRLKQKFFFAKDMLCWVGERLADTKFGILYKYYTTQKTE